MASITETRSIVELYVGWFNRIPDTAGFDFWVGRLDQGSSLAAISNEFFESAVHQFSAETGYTANMTDAEFITQLYDGVMGRTGDLAPNETEIGYWAGKLNGEFAGDKGAMVVQMIKEIKAFDATGNDAIKAVQGKFNNKVQLAMEVVALPDAPGFTGSIEKAKELLSTITEDDATVQTALNAYKTELGLTPKEINLGSGIEKTLGGNGDDTFVGNSATFNAGDEIIAGEGNDKLNLSTDVAGTYSGVNVTGLETLNIRGIAEATVSVTDFDTALNTIEAVNIDSDLTIKDIQEADMKVRIVDTAGNSAGEVVTTSDTTTNVVDVIVDYDITNTAGDTIADIEVKEFQGGYLSVADLGADDETIQLTVTDDATASTLQGLKSGDQADKVTLLTGKAGSTFEIKEALDKSVKTLEATTFAGNIKVSMANTTDALTANLGTGDDVIAFGDVLGDGDTVTDAGGNDTAAVKYASVGRREQTMSGVENLNAIFGAAAEFDGSNVTGLTTININLEADGKTTTASTANADFNDLKSETQTVNIFGTSSATDTLRVELDYEVGANTDLSVDLETEDNALVMNDGINGREDLQLTNVSKLTLTNKGDNAATITDGVRLASGTNELTVATTKEGGNLMIDTGVNGEAFDSSGALQVVTVNAVGGDIRAAGNTQTPGMNIAGDFMDDAGSLQDYTVTADHADLIIGGIGNNTDGAGSNAVNAADLETVNLTMVADATLQQGFINATGASLNEIAITADDKNTIATGISTRAGATASTQFNNVLVDGLTATTVDSMTLNANDGGNIELIDQSYNLKTATFTGTGNIVVEAGLGGLVMSTTASASNHSGSRTFNTDNAANDYIKGSDKADTINDSGSGNDTLEGNAGNDAINVTGTGTYTIDGGTGNDTITLSGSQTTTTVNTSAGNDTIILNAGNGVDNIVYTNTQLTSGNQTTVTGFATGEDKLNFKGIVSTLTTEVGTGLAAGQAVTSVDSNTIYVLADVSTATNNEVVQDFSNLTDVASFLDATVSSSTKTGDVAVFVANRATDDSTGHDAGIYLFQESDGSSGITASEIKFLGTVDQEGGNAAPIVAGDIGTGAGAGGNVAATQSLDALGGTAATAANFDAGTGAFKLTDVVGTLSNVTVANFGADDSIEISGATAAQYDSVISTTNNNNDVVISFNNNGTVNEITLTGVANGGLVFDVASLNGLGVGDISFI